MKRSMPWKFSLKLSAVTIFTVAALFTNALSGCAEESPKKVPMKFDKAERVQDTDSNVTFSRAVDILFVIDDSGSMDQHQQNLATNVSQFTQAMLANQILDYHIGVVTSNMDQQPFGGGSWKGELFGREKFITRLTPNGSAELQANMKPGTMGSSTEMFFTPVVAAVGPALAAGVNKDFFRRDAYLAVIFLTDADDQSTMTAQDFYQTLVSLKGGDPKKLIVYGVYIPTTDTTCQTSEQHAPKLEEFFKLSSAQTLGLCDPDFGVKLGKLGDDLVSRIGSILYLTRPARADTIRVTFGSQVIPNDSQKGWTYDPVRNALLFGRDIVLLPEPPGTQVSVDFVAAEYD